MDMGEAKSENKQNTVPKGKGAMAAVIGAETELIEKCLAPIEDVSIANYNCPGQIVITGKKSAVEQAARYRLPAAWYLTTGLEKYMENLP